MSAAPVETAHDIVEVAVTLPVHGVFHYRVPATWEKVSVGSRVLVPFGRRAVTGIVVHSPARGESPTAEIQSVRERLDPEPVFGPELVELCLWVADYYEAPPGEVFRAALPAGTRISERAAHHLTDKGRAAVDGRSEGALPLAWSRLLGTLATGGRVAPSDPLVAVLLEQGFLTSEDERSKSRVKVRTIPWVMVAPGRNDEPAPASRSPRVAAAWDQMRTLPGGLALASLRKEYGAPAARALVSAELVTVTDKELLRDPWSRAVVFPDTKPPVPTQGQTHALTRIGERAAAGEFGAFLLHGVTGSGKTEVYLRAIAEVLERGQNAMVLVPEIALTPQLASRFRARFGDLVAVLHSGLSAGERYDQWRRLARGDARIALGARSAVFAPVPSLGMIVIDEEHDSSFKQEEGVRYHARDVALVRAQRRKAVCILGSATPSMESALHAQAGRYELLSLRERPSARPMPQVQVLDLKVYRPDPESFMTAPLRSAIQGELAAGRQTILFLNRRGYSSFTVCVACGVQSGCPQCSVSLTYHRGDERLKCHHCGHEEAAPTACKSCGAAGSLRRMGLGTEKVEHGLSLAFPQARLGRLDRDTAKGRGLENILGRMSKGEIDILIGTQMVTKGHDFPGVTLVGVLSADSGLQLPDFRASERTFQLLTQVAGRAGRGDEPGRVLIQTYSPSHHAIRFATQHDYDGFFAAESALRRELGYPPHGRLMALRIDGEDPAAVESVAVRLGAMVRGLMGQGAIELLGPAEAPLKRLKGKHRWHLWLKSGDRVFLRQVARQVLGAFPPVKDVRVTLDVDPVSSL